MRQTYIGARDLGKNTKAVIDGLRKAPAVVTVNGKPKGLFVPVNEGNVDAEIAAWRARHELQHAIAACRDDVRRSGKRRLTMSQIDAEIARARRDRRRRQAT